MNNVPKIISTKDLTYLEDIFNWNFTAAKKALAYSKTVNDEEIKQHMTLAYETHKNICTEIINILE